MRDLQPVSVAGIEFDALIESTEKYSADVPSYPVDTGFSVSDNVAIDALQLDMTLYLTATPVTWLSSHGSGESRMNAICNQLLAAYTQREPVVVVTRDKTYQNMVISSISIEKSQDAVLARSIPITLTQVTVTSSAETEIPAKLAKSGTTQTNAGTAGTTTAASDDSGSTGSGSSGSTGGSGSSSGSDSSGSGGSVVSDSKTWLAGTVDAVTTGIRGGGDVLGSLGSAVIGAFGQ